MNYDRKDYKLLGQGEGESERDLSLKKNLLVDTTCCFCFTAGGMFIRYGAVLS